MSDKQNSSPQIQKINTYTSIGITLSLIFTIRRKCKPQLLTEIQKIKNKKIKFQFIAFLPHSQQPNTTAHNFHSEPLLTPVPTHLDLPSLRSHHDKDYKKKKTKTKSTNHKQTESKKKKKKKNLKAEASASGIKTVPLKSRPGGAINGVGQSINCIYQSKCIIEVVVES